MPPKLLIHPLKKVTTSQRPYPPLRGSIGTIVLIIFFIGGWWYSTRYGQPEVLEFTGPTMGTTYTIKAVEVPNGITNGELQERVDALLANVNRQMSTYDPQSELSRFNQSESTAWVEVSPELVSVIDEAQRVSRLTDGVFDVTVGPLVNLWGFGPQMTGDNVPADDAISEILAKIGYEQLHTRDAPPAVRKDRADIYVDLSAIAKGYAVDKIAEHLESLQIVNYLVEIGGELRGKGQNPGGNPWRIAIEEPNPGQRSIQRVIGITGQGMATSGDYRNFFEKDGQRYSHAIDPRTGWPVRHELASVTVVDASTMYADAMATALLVLGLEKGFELAEQLGLAAFFIFEGTDGLEEKGTSEFMQYLSD